MSLAGLRDWTFRGLYRPPTHPLLLLTVFYIYRCGSISRLKREGDQRSLPHGMRVQPVSLVDVDSCARTDLQGGIRHGRRYKSYPFASPPLKTLRSPPPTLPSGPFLFFFLLLLFLFLSHCIFSFGFLKLKFVLSFADVGHEKCANFELKKKKN